MEDKFYLSAYEEIESISNFSSRSEIKAYRGLLIKKSQEQVDFIINDKYVPKPIRLFEVGTGNSRIPKQLEGQSSTGLPVGECVIA